MFIHPSTVPPGSIVPRLTLPWGIVEFVFDTTRCITNLLYSGTLERYPNIRYIVSHAGGAIPYLALRIQLGEEIPGVRDPFPKGTLHYLRRLYYDTVECKGLVESHVLDDTTRRAIDRENALVLFPRFQTAAVRRSA